MKTFKLVLLMSSAFLLTSCAGSLNILGKKYKSKDVCGNCSPGTYGNFMVLKRPFTPQLDDISNAKSIATNMLGYVFPDGDLTGTIKEPCSVNSADSPFPANVTKSLGNTSGTSFNYNEREILTINARLTAEADIDELAKTYSNLTPTQLSDLQAKLEAAYSKFANKEVTIVGKYQEFALDNIVITKLSKKLDYVDCYNYVHQDNRNKRIITAVGIVFFNVSANQNSIEEVAAKLDAEAIAYNITISLGAEFKRKISKELKKVTTDYYQIVAWRTLGVQQLDNIK